jgi:hypothetical protein
VQRQMKWEQIRTYALRHDPVMLPHGYVYRKTLSSLPRHQCNT